MGDLSVNLSPMTPSIRRARSTAVAVLSVTLGLSLVAVSAQANQGKIEFAKLVHRSDAQAGERTWLKLYTRSIHRNDGEQVNAHFKEKEAAAARQPSPRTPYGVWTVTRETYEGKRLVTALRKRLADDRSAPGSAVVFGPSGGGAEFSFRLRRLNDRARAERAFVE